MLTFIFFKELGRNNMHESTETLHIVNTPWASMHILVYAHMSMAGTRVLSQMSQYSYSEQ